MSCVSTRSAGPCSRRPEEGTIVNFVRHEGPGKRHFRYTSDGDFRGRNGQDALAIPKIYRDHTGGPALNSGRILRQPGKDSSATSCWINVGRCTSTSKICSRFPSGRYSEPGRIRSQTSVSSAHTSAGLMTNSFSRIDVAVLPESNRPCSR